MERSPDKRMGALARVLARALNAEKEGTEGPEESTIAGRSILEDDESLENVLKTVLSRTSRVAQERASAPAQLAELLAMPNHERESAVAMQARFQTYSLASYTLERCEKVVFHDPAMAGELARLARVIAQQTDPRECGGTAALADLEAYAMAMEGNAVRVGGGLPEAFSTFLLARRAQDRGGADPDLSARIDLLESSLRRDLRQFAAAFELLDRAERGFVALNDRNLQARVIINRANVFLVTRELDRVVENLRQALPLAQDPWLALVVRHNLIFALAECGRAREAADLYESSRDLYLQYNDPLTISRRIWAEGLIARELEEDLARAEQLLTQAMERLAEHGYTYDAALAGLDLVTVYARRGENVKVLQVASDLVHLFQSRNVHPEALAALKAVQEAAERQTVNVKILAHAADRVRVNQVRGNPAN
jgi:tetratricopeptide (TPR) repeat protein